MTPPKISTSNYGYDNCVFVNCPFDEQYQPIFRAILFAIVDCGYAPRCALEVADSGTVRITKILDIIKQCRFGIHDISRTELSKSKLPRFNMPFELGLFLGAKEYGSNKQKNKITMILDRDQYRYQKFISDIAGQDVHSHRNTAKHAIGETHRWLTGYRIDNTRQIPNAATVGKRFAKFQRAYPKLCDEYGVNSKNVPFYTLHNMVYEWLTDAT